MKKRIILFLLVMAMTFAVLTGCVLGGAGEETSEPIASDTSDTVSTDYDFGGKDFLILSRKETAYEFAADKGLGGNVIERSVFKRNAQVASDYNVNIKVEKKDGDYEKRDQFLTAVRTEHMTGSAGYDLISSHSVYLGWMAVEGLATDMSSLPGMNFNNSWWNKNLYDELNINGHVYFMLGDICPTIYEYMQVLFVNESAFNDYFTEEGIDVIYKHVEDGDWTWDVLMEYATAFGTTGNTETTQYGLAMNTHSWRASFYAQDAGIYTRADNGDLTVDAAPSYRLTTVVEKMVDFYLNENIMFNSEWGTAADKLNPEFTSGNVLFYPQTLGEVEKITLMSDTYGIIPLPKFDEYQEQYYTICRDTVSAVMIMSTTDDPTMSGVITEALCKASQELVTPEYYETALKVRYLSDEKYGKILDTIRTGLTIDPVPCFIADTNNNLFDLDRFRDQVLEGKKNELASTFGTYAPNAKSELELFYLNLQKQGLY